MVFARSCGSVCNKPKGDFPQTRLWVGTMWADSIMDPEVISILGESLIVFCMVFVSVVVVIKLAERSVDVAGLHVLGGHEIGGGAGHARTGNTHAAASRRNGGAPSPRRGPHDERSRAAQARPESHGKSIDDKGSPSGIQHSSSGNSMSAAGETIPRRNTWSSASLDSFLEASPDAPRLAATGARRRGTHDSSSGDSMSAAGETILRRNTWSSASLDSFLEASPDAPRLAATGARRRGPHDERSRDARARPESDGKSRKGSAPGLRRRSSTDKKMHTPARESLGGMRHSSCSNSECYTGEKLRRKLSCIEEVSSDAFTDPSPHASPLSHKRGTRTEFRHSMTMGEGNMSKRGDAAGGLRPGARAP